MKWFTFTSFRKKRTTVQSKFIAVFATMILMLAIFVWLDISRTQKLQKNNEEIVQIWLKGIQTIQSINYQMEHIDYAKYQILNTKVVQERKDLFADIDNSMLEVDRLLNVYEESIADELDRSSLAALREYWASYNEAYLVFQKAPLYSLEMKEATQQITESLNNVKKMVSPMVTFNHNGALAAESNSASLSRSTTIQMIIAVIVMILIVVFGGFILLRNISVPVKQVSRALERIADGDLTVETIQIKNKDEIGTMVQAVNRMVLHLRTSVNQMLDASNKVAASSEQLLATSKGNAQASQQVAISVQEMASGAELQAQSTQDCSRAMDEITIGIQRIAENTTDASTLTMSATDHAKAGSESMQRVVHKMNAVSNSVDNVNAVLKELEVHSRNIGEISSLIGDISAQTNLLALNASIEAARAGDSGRGFAVVANEVRKLAAQTDAAVQNITKLISSIQSNSKRAVQVMGTGLVEVNEGLQEVNEAEKAFYQIYESTEILSRKMIEAASATQQMAASSEEVAATISNVGSVAQQTSAALQTVASTTDEQLTSSEEITSSATSLLDISQKLYTVVQTFKTQEQETEHEPMQQTENATEIEPENVIENEPDNELENKPDKE